MLEIMCFLVSSESWPLKTRKRERPARLILQNDRFHICEKIRCDLKLVLICPRFEFLGWLAFGFGEFFDQET